MKKLITLLMISVLFVVGGCLSSTKDEKKTTVADKTRAETIYANFQKLAKVVPVYTSVGKRAATDRPNGVYFVNKTTGATKFYPLEVLVSDTNPAGIAFLADIANPAYNVYFVFNNRAGNLLDPQISLLDFDNSTTKTTVSSIAITASTVTKVSTTTGTITVTYPDGTVVPAIVAVTGGSVIVDYKNIKVALDATITTFTSITVTKDNVAYTNFTSSLTTNAILLTTTDASYAAASYKVTISGSAISATTNSATIVKDASVISSSTLVTTGLPGSTANSKVYFKVNDQYGQDLTSSINNPTAFNDGLTVTAKYKDNNMVLGATYDTATANSYFTIADSLTAGKTVVMTITNTVSSVVKGTNTFELAVTSTAATATSITGITVGSASQTSGTKCITLTATIIDQYGNAVDLANTAKLRWTTSNKNVVAFSTTSDSAVNGYDVNAIGTVVSDTTVDGVVTKTAIQVNAIANGTATITVFLPNGTQVITPLTITVTQGTLNAIVNNGATATVVNKAAAPSTAQIGINGSTGARLNFQNSLNNDIAISSSAVSFTIKDASNVDVTTSGVVTLTKVESNGLLTGIKVSTNRTEQNTAAVAANPSKVYTVTVTADGKTQTFTVTSTIDSTVTAISAAAISANQLVANGNVIKKIDFLNQYGEYVEVTQTGLPTTSAVGFAPLTGITFTQAKNSAGDAAANTEAITYIKIAAADTLSGGTYTTAITKGTVTANYSIPVASAAAPATIVISPAAVTVITGDTLDETSPSTTDMTVSSSGITYKIVPVSFKDQYGNAFALMMDKYDFAVTGVTDNTKTPVVEFWNTITDGSIQIGDSEAKEIKYIAVKAVGDDISQNVTIQVRNEANDANVGAPVTLNVTVNATRALTSLSASITSAAMVVNSTKQITFTGKDQYNRDIAIADIDMIAQANIAVTGDTANNTTLTVQPTSAGTYTLTFFNDASANNTLGTNKSTTVVISTTEASAINSIVISTTAAIAVANVTDAREEAALEVLKYKAYVKEGTGGSLATDNTHTFTAKAYDASGNEISILQNQLTWSVSTNSTDTDASGTNTNATITNASNVFTINATTGAHDQVKGSYVVKAVSANGKEATLTVNVDHAAAAATAGSYLIATAAADYTKATTAAISTTMTKFHVVGLDQYGHGVDFNENNTVVTRDDSSIFNISRTAIGLEIYGQKAGTTNLRVSVDNGVTNLTPVAITVSTTYAEVKPTFTSAKYTPSTDTIVLTGTFINTIGATASGTTTVNNATDVKAYIDWSKFTWDINGDNTTTGDVTFVVGDIQSATVTDASTLTILLQAAKGTALEAAYNYGITGGADTIDVAAGFAKDQVGNISPTGTDVKADAKIAHTATITNADYNALTGVITLTGTNFTTIEAATQDIKSLVDWTKFTWDINGDNTTTADVTFAVADITSAVITSATTATITLAPAKKTSLAATAGFGLVGGVDTIDVAAGFIRDAMGTPATGDAIANAAAAAGPTATIANATYITTTTSIILTGTNFDTIAVAGTDVKTYLDWSKITWDINGDNATTTDVTFAVTDITSATVTTATTLTIVLTSTKAAILTTTAGFGIIGGADTIDVAAGFACNVMGKAATTDTATNAVAAAGPSVTITNAKFTATSNAIVLTGTNFTSFADQGTDVKTYLDWSKFVWDIDGNDATTPNAAAFGVGSISSAAITNATTLTITLTSTSGTALKATTSFGAIGGADTVDIAAGFICNIMGKAATTDNVADAKQIPTVTVTSAVYTTSTNTMVVTGTNFTTIAPQLEDVKSLVDWSKFIWDIDGANAADVTFTLANITSATVTNATTLTIVIDNAKASVFEALANYALNGSTTADKLDVTAGFARDDMGQAATGDNAANAALTVNP